MVDHSACICELPARRRDARIVDRPYLVDTFGANTTQVGNASMMMSLAIIAGTFAYGPLDHVFGSNGSSLQGM